MISEAEHQTSPKLVRFDWAIKYLLRHKANFDILEGFLSELLKMPIQIESILESESNQEDVQDKFNRVDILVKVAQGQRIIVEMQCASQWDYLSRLLYGTSKVVCEHIRIGEKYKNICKVISVSIVFFNLGVGKDYLYKGSTTFKGLHFGDTLDLNPSEQQIYASTGSCNQCQTPEDIFPEYYIIKITQFHERIQDKLDEWIYFLKHSQIKPEFSAQGIQGAAKKLAIMQLDETERRRYKKFQESLHDEASFNEMIHISEAKGRIEERKKIAKSLKLTGLSLEQIGALLDLSVEEVRALFSDA